VHFGYAPVRSRWLVNPELIPNKAVTDLVSSLLRVSEDPQDRSAVLGSAYVTLLSIVQDQLRLADCTSIQFAVVRTSVVSVERRLDVVFLSEVHEVAESLSHVC
jgi:hypothetical protein